MPLGVIKENGKLRVIKTATTSIKDAIGYLPSNTPPEDYQFVVECPTGGAKICQEKKSAWMKEQIKNDISE